MKLGSYGSLFRTALRSRRLARCRSYSTSVDLGQAYDRTLNQIATDNRQLLQKYLVTGDTELVSSTDLVRLAGRSLNSSYGRVKASRLDIPRTPEKCSIRDYNEFLRNLYYKDELNYRKLFKAYNALPYPAPYHINGVHLEELMSLLMDSKVEGVVRAHKKADAPKIFMSVLADLIECSMPISTREYNSAMYIIGRSITDEEDGAKKWSLIEDRLAQLKRSHGNVLEDVSTLNILMSIALKMDDKEILDQLVKEFELNGLNPDRYTLMVYMISQGNKHDPEGVLQSYQKLKDSGRIIDIHTLNLVMKSLLKAGDADSAEKMYDTLRRQNMRLVSNPQITESRLMKKVQIMDYLIDIINRHSTITTKYQVPIIPNYNTHNMFLTHYARELGDFEKSLEIFKTMVDQDMVTQHSFYRLYKGFTLHHNSPKWSLDRLHYVTEYLCYYQQQTDLDLFNFVMAENAIKAYRKVTGVQNHPLIRSLEARVKLRTHGGESRHITVHKILNDLLTNF